MRIRRISAAAERLGVHANTLRSLEKRGVIAPKRDWNGYRIFSERDIEEIEKKLFSGKNRETSKNKMDQRMDEAGRKGTEKAADKLAMGPGDK